MAGFRRWLVPDGIPGGKSCDGGRARDRWISTPYRVGWIFIQWLWKGGEKGRRAERKRGGGGRPKLCLREGDEKERETKATSRNEDLLASANGGGSECDLSLKETDHYSYYQYFLWTLNKQNIKSLCTGSSIGCTALEILLWPIKCFFTSRSPDGMSIQGL